MNMAAPLIKDVFSAKLSILRIFFQHDMLILGENQMSRDTILIMVKKEVATHIMQIMVLTIIMGMRQTIAKMRLMMTKMRITKIVMQVVTKSYLKEQKIYRLMPRSFQLQ